MPLLGPTTRSRSARLTGLLLLGSLASTCWAQTASAEAASSAKTAIDEQRWFEVELILFSQPLAQATEKEHWPTDISLAYPPNWVALQDPAALIDSEASTTTDAENEAEALAADVAPEVIANEAAEHSEIDLTQAAFYMLPKELHQLTDKAKYLARSRKHRLLFHKAWRQPVLDNEQAPSLLIKAGNEYGQHSELEGTIELSVARYLHLRTNLWFSEFTHNYGQERGSWPELPARPDLVNFADKFDTSGKLNSADQSDGTSQEDLRDHFSQFDLEPQTDNEWNLDETLQNYQAPNSEFDNIIDQPYLPQRIGLIKQKRRMRSKEIHYIDHPMIGIVILITPYERPAEQAEADSNSRDELAASH